MNSPSTYQNPKYEDDKRPACRYGTNCYQKNPSHRRKFKHPSPNTNNTVKQPAAKKRKSPDEDSAANDTPQTKKQSISPEETQKTDKVPNASKEEEEANKVSSSSEEQTEKVADSSEQKENDKNADSSNKETEKNLDTSKQEAKNNLDSNKQEKEKNLDSSKQETEKNVDSSKQETEKNLKSSEQQNDAIVETTKNTPNTQNKVGSSSDVVKDKVKEEVPPMEPSQLIRKIFLVSMPKDFYKFYDFCMEVKPSDPVNALKIADLKLVGPYDVLSGEIKSDTPDQDKLLTHWRYYYDPPEFQTIIKGNDKEGLHFGYWRDRPSSDPIFVATNLLNISHKIKPAAENIFGAITNYVEERAKKANPFEKTSFNNLLGKLKAFAKKHDYSLEAQTPKMKAREKNVVARTIHGAGIVCPYNKKTQVGYRELSVTDNELLKIVKKIDDARNDEERAGPRAQLGEVVRLATIAGDECDFGTCLELGHDLFSTGCKHVQGAASAVLSIAYSQLERTEFLKIFEAHMKDRKKSCNCSALPPRRNIQLS